jgi:hypothetical protein
VSGVLLLRLLLEPVVLSSSWGLTIGLTLQLDSLGLVGLKLVGNVALLWGLWGSWWSELLDGSLSVGGLKWSWLEGLELLEVEVLDNVGWGWSTSA